MKDEYVFKVMSDRENIFFYENGKLNIKREVDTFGYYPVKIEIRSAEGIDDDIEGELIASIEGLYFSVDSIRDCEYSIFEVFDSIDQNIYNLYEALFDGEEYKEEFDILGSENVFYLDNIIVEEAYRKKGICKMIINQIDEIIKYIADLNIGVIATNLYESSDKELNDKLSRLLMDKAFVKASSDNSYFVLNVL